MKEAVTVRQASPHCGAASRRQDSPCGHVRIDRLVSGKPPPKQIVSISRVTSFSKMSTDQDQARQIAERVARRVAGERGSVSAPQPPTARPTNGAPVREEITAIREGLHDLESKLERIESKLVNGSAQTPDPPRARVIDFVAAGPPLKSQPRAAEPIARAIAQPPSVAETSAQVSSKPPAEFFQFVPATQSPWLGRLSSMLGENPQSPNPQKPSHPSQERFGVEEATVKELVEFFESEKKCSVEPGDKPCDHCAMCSSRGF
jgi:hypothetical protein